MLENRYKCYCENYQDIENYDKAKADNFNGWSCHHRLETHTSDGERRIIDITQKELIALDMYWHRPAEELIFLRHSEHNKLHKEGKPTWTKGCKLSEEHRRKISDAMKWHLTSEDTKRKISEANKGKHSNKGMHWELVDGKRVYY